MFDDENWETLLFKFFDMFVACIRGRGSFDEKVAITSPSDFHIAALITVSDIAFCMNVLDNNLQVWKTLRMYGGKDRNVPLSERRQPKFTNRRSKNSSKDLKEAYEKKYGAIKTIWKNSLDLQKLSTEFKEYMEAKFAKESAENSGRTGTSQRTNAVVQPDEEDKEEWIDY